MIRFSNTKNNTLRNKKVTDFPYFALQMDARRRVFFDIGLLHGISYYATYTELDSGESYFGAMSYSDDDTFFDAFGEDYKNIHILERINIDMDCIVNQDYE